MHPLQISTDTHAPNAAVPHPRPVSAASAAAAVAAIAVADHAEVCSERFVEVVAPADEYAPVHDAGAKVMFENYFEMSVREQ